MYGTTGEIQGCFATYNAVQDPILQIQSLLLILRIRNHKVSLARSATAGGIKETRLGLLSFNDGRHIFRIDIIVPAEALYHVHFFFAG